jgi:hypothetical protein
MTRVAALAAALAAALVAGAEAPAKVEGRLFGLLGTQGAQFVVEVDTGTLEPIAGRRLKVAPAGAQVPWTWTLDPSRHILAIARGNRLRLIDLSSLRPVGSVKLNSLLEPSGVLWLRPDRIVVLCRGFAPYEAVVIDVARRRIVARRELTGGAIIDSERTRSEVVILRAPTSAIGPASLLVVDGVGEAREIALPRILAGWFRDTDADRSNQNVPALALDAAHRFAYVVAPDGLVAEVELHAGAVRYHALRGAFAKLVSGSLRQAAFVDGKIVVTGTDSVVWTRSDGKPAMRTDPAGLAVIDPTTWQTRRLASNVSSVFPWAGGFLATGGSWTSESPENYPGVGLAVYGLDGVERFRLLDGKRIWISAVYGNRAYVTASNEPLQIVDLESGRVLGTRKGSLPWLLLEQNAPVW